MRGLILFLSVSTFGLAGTVETTADCGGNPVHGTSFATCQGAGGGWAWAKVEPWLVEADVLAMETDASASVNYLQEFTLTITGGMGNGYAEPCLFAAGEDDSSSGMSSGAASLGNSRGGVMVWGPGPYPWSLTGNCNDPTPAQGSVPFTFGVPQTVTLSLSASASAHVPLPGMGGIGAYGSAALNGFRIFDEQMDLLSGAQYALTPAGTGLPEPATLPLVGAFATMMLVMKGRTRQRGGRP